MSELEKMFVSQSKPWRVTFNGTVYTIREHGGLYKVATNSAMGWTSVWADSMEELAIRLRAALRGGQ